MISGRRTWDLTLQGFFRWFKQFAWFLKAQGGRSPRSLPHPTWTIWYFYRLQTKLRKVMFLHLSVILFTGGCTPRQTAPPPRRPLQRAVRILLECTLLLHVFDNCQHFSLSHWQTIQWIVGPTQLQDGILGPTHTHSSFLNRRPSIKKVKWNEQFQCSSDGIHIKVFWHLKRQHIWQTSFSPHFTTLLFMYTC